MIRMGTTVVALAATMVMASVPLAFGGTAAPAPSPSAPLVVASPVPTPTSAPSPTAPQWIAAACATGEFTGVETDAERNTVVSATVSICGTHKEKFSFTLAAFLPGRPVSVVSPYDLRPYRPDGPTPVRGGLRSAPSSGEMGVCSLRSSTVRVACVRLTFTLTGPTTMEPISVDDPLVATAVVSVDPAVPAENGGFCGSCVALR